MLIKFNKYQAAGNDFIIIDNMHDIFPDSSLALISRLCSRRFGIGADGLILICNHADHAFEMKYFNSDGKIGSMCGNGGRCAFAFAVRNKIISGESEFMASDGLHTAKFESDNTVTITIQDVEEPKVVSGNLFIDTGSPHYIIPVPDVSKVDVKKRGRVIRNTEQFAPDGTNVNFIEIGEKSIKVRTYERGVEDETLACGTGVTAAAIASKWDESQGIYKVDVNTPGGQLKVVFNLESKRVSSLYLTGPAELVYQGVLETENL